MGWPFDAASSSRHLRRAGLRRVRHRRVRGMREAVRGSSQRPCEGLGAVLLRFTGASSPSKSRAREGPQVRPAPRETGEDARYGPGRVETPVDELADDWFDRRPALVPGALSRFTVELVSVNERRVTCHRRSLAAGTRAFYARGHGGPAPTSGRALLPSPEGDRPPTSVADACDGRCDAALARCSLRAFANVSPAASETLAADDEQAPRESVSPLSLFGVIPSVSAITAILAADEERKHAVETSFSQSRLAQPSTPRVLVARWTLKADARVCGRRAGRVRAEPYGCRVVPAASVRGRRSRSVVVQARCRCL